jgi:NarL family two-component system response regulator LiaR
MDNSAAVKTAVFLIEDHPLTRHGLVSCLEDTDRFSVAGEASSLEEARRIIRGRPSLPDLVILDIMMEGENGLDFIPFLKQFCETQKVKMPAVLVCSVFEDPFRIRSAVQLGARGYIPKSAGETELLRAVDIILSGGIFLDEKLNLKIGGISDVFGKFTRRERQILAMIKQNYTNQRIAKELFISQRTVENHISHIYLKTGCNDRQQLMDV